MSQERDDKWLRDIYVHYIDMLAKILERNLLKAIISVTDLDKNAFLCYRHLGSLGLLWWLGFSCSDSSPVITLLASMLLCGLKQDSDAHQG